MLLHEFIFLTPFSQLFKKILTITYWIAAGRVEGCESWLVSWAETESWGRQNHEAEKSERISWFTASRTPNFFAWRPKMAQFQRRLEWIYDCRDYFVTGRTNNGSNFGVKETYDSIISLFVNSLFHFIQTLYHFTCISLSSSS